MSVDLSETQYRESLQRAVTPLGQTPASLTNAQWTGYLTDAFNMAKLDGFMQGYTLSDTEIVTDSGGADLDAKYVSLVILYAAIQILALQILNTNTGFRAKAGPVEFEQQTSATMLAEMLKQLERTKDRIILELDELGATETLVLDALSVRTFELASYWGSIELTG